MGQNEHLISSLVFVPRGVRELQVVQTAVRGLLLIRRLLSSIRRCSATVTSSTLCWASHSCLSLQPEGEPTSSREHGLQRNMAGVRPGELRGVPQGHGWENKPVSETKNIYYLWKLKSVNCTVQELTKAHTLCLPELPEHVIKMAKDIKPITEIQQKGNDFVVTSKTPGQTVTNSFTIGKEADITTMDGKKLKVCSLWV